MRASASLLTHSRFAVIFAGWRVDTHACILSQDLGKIQMENMDDYLAIRTELRRQEPDYEPAANAVLEAPYDREGTEQLYAALGRDGSASDGFGPANDLWGNAVSSSVSLAFVSLSLSTFVVCAHGCVARCCSLPSRAEATSRRSPATPITVE